MPTLTTRLEAVNTILGAVGEAPVTSLTSTTADAAVAQNVLEEVSREVQAEGWNFNTEKNVPFVRDESGHINLPTNVLKFDVIASNYPDINPVVRGTRVYDVENHTYVFTTDLKAEVVYFLDFTELPEMARRYITVKAARLYHDRFVGSNELHSFTSQDEERARWALRAENATSSDHNFFNNRFGASILRRR
jgi:hypothetical protein